VLLSSAAVFSGPWLTGIELDVSALMGLTKVIGMVTELIVFYLSELDQAAAVDAESQRKAGAKRLRPILMSALIAILTLSPLAMAIIFGLTAAVPLVLLVLPALILGVFGPYGLIARRWFNPSGNDGWGRTNRPVQTGDE
jgi:multidrug efflux pump subunit AcrB